MSNNKYFFLPSSIFHLLLFLFSISLFSSCDFLFGKKQDGVTKDIFTQGAIDPNVFPNSVGYVPVLPIWKNIPNPVDVLVGYDNMVYVCDDNGLDIFDLKGTLQRNIPILNATDVCQDRRLHTFVVGRINKIVNGNSYNLACMYHIMNASTSGTPLMIDTLIHPFCDVSRNNSAFRGIQDEQVQFTGVTSFADNSIAISRSGPANDLSSVARPDNTILFFDSKGVNTNYSNGLNPLTSSLKSELGISSIVSFAAPPQSTNGISTSQDFLITQTDAAAEYKVLWIKQIVDPDNGNSYAENSSLINFDFSKADRFLYTQKRFTNPSDVFAAPDFSGYIFVVDATTDSLYQFTRKGFEGVNAPPNFSSSKQIIASFGGSGSGPFNFNQPSGVCYFNKIIYVADKGNNRICRFKLSSDVE